MPVAVIVLAAGQGTRMNSDLPKVLHPLGRRPLLAHVLAAARSLEPERIVVVVGHGGDAVAAAARGLDEAVDRRRPGRAEGHRPRRPRRRAGARRVRGRRRRALRRHAAGAARDAAGDARGAGEGAAVVVLGFEAAEPGGYGRLILDGARPRRHRRGSRRDARRSARSRLCNSGMLAADARLLFELLAAVEPDNAKGEYYLTDVVGLARAAGLHAAAITCPEARDARGQLARPTSPPPRPPSRRAPGPTRWPTAPPSSTRPPSGSPSTP